MSDETASINVGLFGSAMAMDIVFDFGDKALPAEDHKGRAEESYFQTGGNSVNAAFAFAMLQGTAECAVSVGTLTPFRGQVLDDFDKYDITLRDQATPDFKLPYSAIALTIDRTGKRAYRTLWTNEKDDTYEPLPFSTDQITMPDIMMLDLYYPVQTREMIDFAKQHNIPVVVDIDKWNDYYEELLPHVDYVIASEKFQPPGCTSPKKVLEFLHDRMDIPHVAITRGDKSILAMEEGQHFSVPVHSVEAVDALGAGDIFHGAFTKFILVNGGNFQDALSLAGEVATKACEHKGHDWMLEEKRELADLQKLYPLPDMTT